MSEEGKRIEAVLGLIAEGLLEASDEEIESMAEASGIDTDTLVARVREMIRNHKPQ